MPVMPVCCDPRCNIPSAYLVTFYGLVLCCGVLTLTPINGVTFVYLPLGAKNYYIGTAANFLQTTFYDGASNCNTASPVNSVAALDLEVLGGVPRVVWMDNYQYNGLGGIPVFDGPTGQNGAVVAPKDGMIFDWDPGYPAPGPIPALPIGTMVFQNNANNSGPACTFPDPFLENNIARGGTATVVPVCTALTITGASPASGSSVSSASGTGSVTFTAVNATGGAGDWYAAKTFGGGVIFGTFGDGSTPDALTFTSATSGTGGTTLTFSYATNTTGSARTFSMAINDKTYFFTQNP